MDWTKAKTILITALVVTNVILISVVVTVQIKENKAQEVRQETVAMLAEKNIVLATDIPTKKTKMPVLAIRYEANDEEKIKNLIAIQALSPDYEDTETWAQKASDEFIKECGYKTKNVKASNVSKEKNGEYTVTYKNVINGKEIEDNYISCIVEKGMIKSVQRRWFKPIEYGKTKKQTIPATTALMSFAAEKKNEKELVIKDISMVYWLDTSYVNPEITESDTAFPAWRITYDGGKKECILAYEIN